VHVGVGLLEIRVKECVKAKATNKYVVGRDNSPIMLRGTSPTPFGIPTQITGVI